MSDNAPDFSTIRQRLHAGRRDEVAERFLKAVHADGSLRIHQSPAEQVDAWRAIHSRIFEAVFDRYDFFDPISDLEYKTRCAAIFKDMRYVGVAEDMAQKEFTRIAYHAMLEVGEVHADDKQREMLNHRDSHGRRHRPDGTFAENVRSAHVRDTVRSVIEEAQLSASGVKAHHAKYDRLYQLIEQKMQEEFWGNRTSMIKVLDFATKDYGYPRHVVLDAVNLDLFKDYPELPVPSERRQPHTVDPKTVLKALHYGEAYEPAIKVALYGQLSRYTKGAMAQLLTEYPDPAVLSDDAAREKFFQALGQKIKPVYEQIDMIANKRLSMDEFVRFHEHSRDLLSFHQDGLRGFIAEAVERNMSSGKDR